MCNVRQFVSTSVSTSNFFFLSFPSSSSNFHIYSVSLCDTQTTNLKKKNQIKMIATTHEFAWFYEWRIGKDFQNKTTHWHDGWLVETLFHRKGNSRNWRVRRWKPKEWWRRSRRKTVLSTNSNIQSFEWMTVEHNLEYNYLWFLINDRPTETVHPFCSSSHWISYCDDADDISSVAMRVCTCRIVHSADGNRL